MNTVDAYKESIEIAKRYIKHATLAIGALGVSDYAKYGSKDIAQVKRTSMDLTRILAEVRKPFNN
jgi:hypothetical protein